MPYSRYMTKKQVLADFRENIAPYVRKQYGRDSIAMREAFSNYVDSLNKDGIVSSRQANTWSNPF